MGDQPGSSFVKLILREQLLKPGKTCRIFSTCIKTPHGVQALEPIMRMAGAIQQDFSSSIMATIGLYQLHVASSIITLPS